KSIYCHRTVRRPEYSCQFLLLSGIPPSSLFFAGCAHSRSDPLTMLGNSLFTVLTLGLATVVSGASLTRRGGDVLAHNIGGWVNHDKVEPFPEAVVQGLVGLLQLQFKPMLNVPHGCFPYPALNRDGWHGKGLRPAGKKGGDCRHQGQKGQIYVRTGKSNGQTGILYAWYLPKVQAGGNADHRHYWISVVVWIHAPSCGAPANEYQVAGISYSDGPDTYYKGFSRHTQYSSSEMGTGTVGTHAIVGYNGNANVYHWNDKNEWPIKSPMISWEMLPQVARDQLNGMKYEKARCPFTDENFQASLDAAFETNFYRDLTAKPGGDCDPTSPLDKFPGDDDVDEEFEEEPLDDPLGGRNELPEDSLTEEEEMALDELERQELEESGVGLGEGRLNELDDGPYPWDQAQ
ncbi:hypothetical protein CTA1_8942, partial [Colletotrichum tanaceti]